MYTDLDKEIILKFLKRNYPISRIKQNMRFKRAIILENGKTYFLCEDGDKLNMKRDITETIKKIFPFDDKFIGSTINSFIGSK